MQKTKDKYINGQIYEIEIALSAIQMNIDKEEVHNEKGRNFFDYQMKNIYFRLELLKEAINKKLEGDDKYEIF